MRWITLGDLIDVYAKGKQRGLGFLFSKFNINALSRTKSAFSNSSIDNSNWWIIPKVKERWNRMMTGNPQQNYKQYLAEEILKGEKDIKLISLGSGSCGNELELAAYSQFGEITCLDLAPNRLKIAADLAKERKLNNLKFVCSDINDFNFTEGYYDIVLFNSSLHHFEDVHGLLNKTIKPALKLEGRLVINEFVGPNRLQFPSAQIKAVNEALQLIPKRYRQRFKSSATKSRFYGSGVWRMIMADPSECVDSASIMSAIHSSFKTVVEKPYGGNILMNALKDISHHFVELDAEKEKILEDLFAFEDHYLKTQSSDFVFGVYSK